MRSVLGKTRFELFRDGKVTLKAMSADGRIKRLSELVGGNPRLLD